MSTSIIFPGVTVNDSITSNGIVQTVGSTGANYATIQAAVAAGVQHVFLTSNVTETVAVDLDALNQDLEIIIPAGVTVTYSITGSSYSDGSNTQNLSFGGSGNIIFNDPGSSLPFVNGCDFVSFNGSLTFTNNSTSGDCPIVAGGKPKIANLNVVLNAGVGSNPGFLVSRSDANVENMSFLGIAASAATDVILTSGAVSNIKISNIRFDGTYLASANLINVATTATDVVISNIITSTDSATPDIEIAGVDRISVIGVTSSTTNPVTITFSGAGTSTNLLVENCRIQSMSVASSCLRMRIANNLFYASSGNMLSIAGGINEALTIQGNNVATAEGANTSNYSLNLGRGSNMTGNRLGCLIMTPNASCSNNVIDGNMFEGDGTNASLTLLVENSMSSSMITNNKMEGASTISGSSYCINATNLGNCVVSGNHMNAGIYITGASHNGPIVSQNIFGGLRMDGGGTHRGLMFTGNQVNTTLAGLAALAVTGTLTECALTGNTFGGFVGSGAVTATGGVRSVIANNTASSFTLATFSVNTGNTTT